MSKYKLRDISSTDEQDEIIEAARSTSDSLLINALAGAAKTTTLEFLCAYMPVQPILSLAFNKRIAEEMKKRLPGHVNAATMNSVGHRVWAAATGRRLVVDTSKNYNLLKAQMEGMSHDEKAEVWEIFGDIRKAIAAAKLQGYVPPGAPPHAKRLCSRNEFYASLEASEEIADEVLGYAGLIDRILCESIRLAYGGSIDFDDQIYMPTLFGGSFPRYPLVMVDEAQDLSPLNHAMLERLVTKRIIAVGDPWQSIYAFRGAATSSMQKLKSTFAMRELTLSVSFRCPQNVVRNVQARVPHMKWAPGAAEGVVARLDDLSIRDIPDGSAIICRNNAPLFAMAMRLLQNARGVHLVGTDLGPALIRAFKKLGPPEMTREQVYEAITRWESEKLATSRSPGAVTDKADCFRVFAGFGDNLGTAVAFAENLFAHKGPIQLLSGHKAKGLEWDVVYHLDPWRVPSKYASSPESKEQELNIRYVIETRAKRELYLVDFDKVHA